MSGARLVCGLDEAGRGPLAGPVCAAAVVLGPGFPLELLDDSKKLSEKRREEARKAICERALFWEVAWASPAEIDEINILRASLLAMKRAFNALSARVLALRLPDAQAAFRGDSAAGDSPFADIVVDGTFCPDIGGPVRSLVKADALVCEVMAASILAKTARDRMMARWDWIYPGYGYAAHKGYPTRAHREAIGRLGPSPIQRHSFTVKPL